MNQNSVLQNPNSPPFSPEAEEAVLGAVLVNPDALLNITAFLQPEDFFLVRHATIWRALIRLSERNEPVDLLTVNEELSNMGREGDVGGLPYLAQLVANTPTSIHAEVYGRLVERAAIRRKLLIAADEIKSLAMDEDQSIERVTEEAEARLFKVTDRQIKREFVPIRDAINEFSDRIEYLIQNRDQPLGLPTGFKDLDKLLGGLQKSDLMIFAGRPGMGKTSWLLTIALNAARLRGRIAIFTMEMGVEQIVQRIMSMETGINMQKMRLGQLTPQEHTLFVEATGKVANLRIFIDDTPSMSPSQIRAKCRRLAHEQGIDLVIIDYLQLMSGGSTSFNNNRVQEVSYISRAMKELARELNVPVLAAAQLSRAVEQRQDKRPQLSDLRESGCLAGESLVYLPDEGRHVPIRELVGKTGFRVTSLNTDTWKLEPGVVTNAFCTGTKPVYRMTTRLGRTIRATGNHKFLTICGWKRLDELTTYDHIALPRVLDGPTEQTMSDDELALLGHLIGDGCTLPTHAIQYTTREYDLAEIVANLARRLFADAVEPRIYKEPGHGWYQVFIPSTKRLTHNVSSPVTVWLRELGAFGLRSYEKHIPDKVFAQPREAIALFLRHLWATDGSIGVKVTTRLKRYPNIYYASSSERLARDVQTLLLRLGINSRLSRVSQNGKGRDQYHVTVSGKPDLECFLNEIGPVGQYREQRALQALECINNSVANTNRDVIPNIIWREYAVPAMKQKGLTARQMQSALGNAYCGTGLYKQNVSRERAARLADVVNDPTIAQLSQSDVYWDSIEAIEPDGEAEVFDLTVPSNSCFIVSCMVSHNSLEQDADIVMFLYRDAVYNDATENPNLADVIIAKHRNGPTGTISLYFNKSITRFEDAEVRRINLDDL